MNLKPQDLLVALKLAAWKEPEPATQMQLALALDMSQSEVHGALKRGSAAGLIRREAGRWRPNPTALAEFLVHGVSYAFVPDRGGMTRGIPTAEAAPVLHQRFAAGNEPAPVWPHPEGTHRGLSFSPLYRSAAAAALRDPALYDLLALVDALRGGRARARKLAVGMLEKRLALLS